jgi:hypothetical protein
MQSEGPSCQLRFAHDMVSEPPLLLPRGVTVAQVTLDHFVMVRIHARQPFDAPEACSWQAIRFTSHTERGLASQARRMDASHALSKPRARRTGWLRHTVGILQSAKSVP